MQGAYGIARQSETPAQPAASWRDALPGAAAGATAAPRRWLPRRNPPPCRARTRKATGSSRAISTPRAYLKQAKEQFVRIQGVWDSGDTERLREYLIDDLIVELKPQLTERQGAAHRTEVVLLNAEMLGIEAVSDGHLASVRFSGMLREEPERRSLLRFEEVWNLFKPTQGGWLLAGIQQIPVQPAELIARLFPCLRGSPCSGNRPSRRLRRGGFCVQAVPAPPGTLLPAPAAAFRQARLPAPAVPLQPWPSPERPGRATR